MVSLLALPAGSEYAQLKCGGWTFSYQKSKRKYNSA